MLHVPPSLFPTKMRSSHLSPQQKLLKKKKEEFVPKSTLDFYVRTKAGILRLTFITILGGRLCSNAFQIRNGNGGGLKLFSTHMGIIFGGKNKPKFFVYIIQLFQL